MKILFKKMIKYILIRPMSEPSFRFNNILMRDDFLSLNPKSLK